MNENNPMSNPRFVIGAGIVLFGLVLMLDRLGVVDANYVLRLWPLIIIAFGLQRFFNPRAGRSNATGIVIMAVGGVFLLQSLGVMRASIWELFWPGMLIFFGWRLMQRTTPALGARSLAGGSTEATERLTMISILGGGKRVSNASPFRGGDLTAFMGGGQIDLRGATIPPGEEAVIEVLAVMGGYEILIPAHWVIVTPLIPIMGGIDDRRFAPPPAASDVAGQSAPRLVLRGFVMMGGIAFKN
jgi:predicted membrane protein